MRRPNGSQRIVAQRTFILATAEFKPLSPTDSTAPFEINETTELFLVDVMHSPVLADYWGDDADDDLIANP